MPDGFLSNVMMEEHGIKLPACGMYPGCRLVARCIACNASRALLASPITCLCLPHVAGDYAVGQVYLPRDETLRHKARDIIDRVTAEMGHDFIAWRRVPTNNRSLGASALSTEPIIEQVGR